MNNTNLMRRIVLLLLSAFLVLGCNGEKKQAAYECEQYLNLAERAFSEGDYQVSLARQSRDWDSSSQHLQEAMRYFQEAGKNAKEASSIASYYESTVEDEADKAARASSDAYSNARRAAYSTNNNEVERLTSQSQRDAYDGKKAIEQAKRYLWY